MPNGNLGSGNYDAVILIADATITADGKTTMPFTMSDNDITRLNSDIGNLDRITVSGSADFVIVSAKCPKVTQICIEVNPKDEDELDELTLANNRRCSDIEYMADCRTGRKWYINYLICLISAPPHISQLTELFFLNMPVFK